MSVWWNAQRYFIISKKQKIKHRETKVVRILHFINLVKLEWNNFSLFTILSIFQVSFIVKPFCQNLFSPLKRKEISWDWPILTLSNHRVVILPGKIHLLEEKSTFISSEKFGEWYFKCDILWSLWVQFSLIKTDFIILVLSPDFDSYS